MLLRSPSRLWLLSSTSPRIGGGRRGLQHQLSTSSSVEERAAAAILNTYGSPAGMRAAPGLVFVKGQGARLYDTHGKEYLDMAAGIAVNALGHGDVGWAKAMYEQALQLGHMSNLFHTLPAVELAEKLLNISPGFSRVFFANSGTESNEGAFKFAQVRSLAHKTSPSKKKIIAFTHSFHGRTMGSLSCTHKSAIRMPFEPLLNTNVQFCEFNDVADFEAKMDPTVLAVIVEPVQGEGGVNPATREFMRSLRRKCTEHGATLIFDEIQAGLGRSGAGKIWAFEHYDVRPDILTMAKPLANGMPIGAILVSKEFDDSIPRTIWGGIHGTTFGGNPVVCKAASYVLDRITSPTFLANVAKSGAVLIKELDKLQREFPKEIVKVRRPLGDEALFAGVQFANPIATTVTQKALKRFAVFITAGDKNDTIRICPPLIITEEQVCRGVRILGQAIADVHEGKAG